MGSSPPDPLILPERSSVTDVIESVRYRPLVRNRLQR
jgi:hypothetical protein